MIITALAIGLGSASTGLAEEESDGDVTLQMNVHIPTRDGSYLNATLYRPAAATKPVPVVFMLTPYEGDDSHPSGSYFARHGIAYAFVDSRGRGDSPGTFTPFENDGRDGYDIVEWLAKQPWADGQVAMFGGSYAGNDQWQVAALHPPHLTTIAPVASPFLGVDFPGQDNMLNPYDIQWLIYTTGHTLYRNVFNDTQLWTSIYKRFYLSGQAFTELDKFAGNSSDVFQMWAKHPDHDSYWQHFSPTQAEIAAIDLPMLVITGAHDGDQAGTFAYLNRHITSPDGMLPTNYYFVIGPWDHAGTRQPSQDFSGEHFGAASLVDILRLHLEWYRHTMLGAPLPGFLRKQVAYYVSGEGAECWKYADSLMKIPRRTRTLYLNADGDAHNLYKAGILQDAAAGARGGEWTSDPSDLRNAEPTKAPPGDDLHGDGLVFQTAPFTQEAEIDGQTALKLSLSIDGPDADIQFRLYLITPEGKFHWLSEGARRARYRRSFEHAEMVKPGVIETYDMPLGYWFAVRAPKGSRLRLIVQSLNEPHYQKNWNSAKPVAEQTSADAHREVIRLFQTASHPSTLTLPLGDVAALCTASSTW